MSTVLPVIIDPEIPVYLEQTRIGEIPLGSVVTYTDLLDATLHIFNRHSPISKSTGKYTFRISAQVNGQLVSPQRNIGEYSHLRYWPDFAYRLTLGRSLRPSLVDPNILASYTPGDICAGRPITDDLPTQPASLLMPVIEKMVISTSYRVDI